MPHGNWVQEAMQPERFLSELRAAFPSTPIHGAGAFTQWGTTYSDVAPYMKHLEGKTWEQLDRAYLLLNSDALGFLGTSHLIAVLPVYLRSFVEEGVWSAAAGMLPIILTRPEPGTDAGLGVARFDALVDALTDAQRTVVSSALRAFADQDPDGSPGRAAGVAFDSHWKSYLHDNTQRDL
jgi:hypothetical protein